MAFWTDVKSEPTRKYRFLISADGQGTLKGNWWWAKTISKQSFEINQSSYQLGNHKFKYPGVLSWNDIEMTMVDVGSGTKDLFANLEKVGYDIPTNKMTGIGKNQAGSIKQVAIQQLDSNGEIIEHWVLYNVVITRISFGDMSYSDDEIVELTMTLTYDYANLIKK